MQEFLNKEKSYPVTTLPIRETFGLKTLWGGTVELK